MSWRDFHDISIEYSSLAEGLERKQDIGPNLEAFKREHPEQAAQLNLSLGATELMLQLYRLAAEAEEEAITALDLTKQKTLGISAVRSAALWLKAREFRQTQRVCDYWISKADSGEFPDFAVVDLEDLLNIIQLRFDLKAEDIFCPGEPIKRRKKELFVGRIDEMKEAVELIKSGFSLVISGEKGVGKTSFTWQLMELLAGEPQTCDRWRWSPEKPYSCVWLDCTTEMCNLEGVLISLLQPSTRDYTYSRNFPEIWSLKTWNNQVKNAYESFYTFSKDFQNIVDNSNESKQRKKSDLRLEIRELFREIQVRISNPYTIVFLDSFEQVPNHEGLGKLIIDCADREFVSFVIIGNCQKVGKIPINDDHASSARKLCELAIKGLNEEDINSLLDKLQDQYFHTVLWDWRFRKAFIQKLKSESIPIPAHDISFQPEQIQRLAYYSAKKAFESKRDFEESLIITSNDVDSANSNPKLLLPSLMPTQETHKGKKTKKP